MLIKKLTGELIFPHFCKDIKRLIESCAVDYYVLDSTDEAASDTPTCHICHTFVTSHIEILLDEPDSVIGIEAIHWRAVNIENKLQKNHVK